MSRMPPLTEEKVLVPTQLLRNLLFQIRSQAYYDWSGGKSLSTYFPSGIGVRCMVDYLEDKGCFDGDYFELKNIVEGL